MSLLLVYNWIPIFLSVKTCMYIEFSLLRPSHKNALFNGQYPVFCAAAQILLAPFLSLKGTTIFMFL